MLGGVLSHYSKADSSFLRVHSSLRCILICIGAGETPSFFICWHCSDQTWGFFTSAAALLGLGTTARTHLSSCSLIFAAFLFVSLITLCRRIAMSVDRYVSDFVVNVGLGGVIRFYHRINES